MWQHTVNSAILNFSGAGTVANAMLGYTSSPNSGNLYFSLSASSGSDSFGNTFPTGLAVQSGQVQGVSLVGTNMDNTSTLLGTSIQNAQVLTPNINGGTAASLVHTMTNTGGAVLGYSSIATSSVTFSTNGVSQWTCPAGVSFVRVQCWGAGAGGNGAGTGSHGAEGGPGGGAGEYSEEPSYPVSAGQVYQVVVGQGGSPGSLNQVGSDGTPSQFYPNGGAGLTVQANPGIANGGFFLGGPGGSGSTNTIHFNGGNGADGNGGTGGAGGGSSAGPNAQGNQGSGPSGSTGGAGGSAVSGGGAGGAGGNNTVNGSNGSGPGGGGGGGGYASTPSSQSLSYEANASTSYYGSDAPSPNTNQRRVINGTIYQGGETASGGAVNGTQKSLFSFPQARIQSDWTGWTITSCTLWVTNEHTWYNSGMTFLIGYYNATVYPPSTWNGSGSTKIATATIAEGARHGFGLGAITGQRFAAQASPTIYQISFGPGPAFDLNYYGYFNGTPNNSNGPVLTINGNKAGTTGGTGGSGADGKVIITYATNSTQNLILSVSATTTVDQFGNPFGKGVTTFNGSGGTVATVDSSGVSSLGGGSVIAQMNSSGLTLFNVATPGSTSNAVTLFANTSTGVLSVVDGTDGDVYSIGQQIMVLGNSTSVSSGGGTSLFSTTVASGRSYRIHGTFYLSISGANQQLSLGVGTPGTGGGQLSAQISRAAVLVSMTNFGVSSLTGIGPAGSLVAGSVYVCWLDGIVNINSTGTLVVTFAGTNTNDITVAQNSYVELSPA